VGGQQRRGDRGIQYVAERSDVRVLPGILRAFVAVTGCRRVPRRQVCRWQTLPCALYSLLSHLACTICTYSCALFICVFNLRQSSPRSTSPELAGQIVSMTRSWVGPCLVPRHGSPHYAWPPQVGSFSFHTTARNLNQAVPGPWTAHVHKSDHHPPSQRVRRIQLERLQLLFYCPRMQHPRGSRPSLVVDQLGLLSSESLEKQQPTSLQYSSSGVNEGNLALEIEPRHCLSGGPTSFRDSGCERSGPQQRIPRCATLGSSRCVLPALLQRR
jgi:hypothetical protein